MKYNFKVFWSIFAAVLIVAWAGGVDFTDRSEAMGLTFASAFFVAGLFGAITSLD